MYTRAHTHAHTYAHTHTYMHADTQTHMHKQRVTTSVITGLGEVDICKSGQGRDSYTIVYTSL